MRYAAWLSRLVAASAVCAGTTFASAQAPAATSATPAPLDAARRRNVVDTLSARLIKHYVDADTGLLIAARLKGRLTSGAYDALTSPARFAEVLTTDLRSVNGDRHLNVTYSPEQPGLRPGPEGIRMGTLPPALPTTFTPVPDPVRRGNYSLGRVDVLPGNVGYLDIRGFSGAANVVPALKAVFEYLQGTDAIIFDLRHNGGGSPFSVNAIISHFTTADTVASLTVRNRSANQTFTRYTYANVPGPRRPTVPLYVLTSGATASAGEDFTFVLKNMKRATIVGGTTAGAGHNNANLDIGEGFNASISFTRVVDPKTGAEWERVGVTPDVPVDQAKALDVAHVLALKTIAASESDPRRRRVLDLTREGIEAQVTPRVVPTATLRRYVGEYDGGRMVAVDGNALTFSARPGAPPDPTVALTDSTFAFGALRLAFERDASGRTIVRLTPPEGESLTYARVK
ncbi:MAG TPA: S41 family peptidase [Gemmatimonadaceae bacterium]|nr:S41 family peptidase [Gemmatimonadaceae bacterium]